MSALLKIVLPLLLASCGPSGRTGASTPASLPPGVVLEWSVSHFQGSSQLRLHDDGRLEAQRWEGAGFVGDATSSAAGTLSAGELEALYQFLADARACRLGSRREHGVPDEARPSLQLAWRELQCSVTMWDGEWRDRSHGISGRLDEITGQVLGRR